MKVLHAIDRLQAGGAEKMFVTLTSLLSAANIPVAALLFNSGYELDHKLDKGVRLRILNRQNRFNPVTLYKAHKICSEYDIVHAHLRHVYAYLRLAQWLFRGKYKLLIHDHGAVVQPIPCRLKGVFRPQYYIGVNNEQVIWAKTHLFVNEDKAFLLENTIIPVKPADGEVNRGTKKAMMIANIRRVKNIEFAIRLCQAMGWRLDIYGNIAEKDYYDELMQLINNNPRIRIISGISDFSGIYGHYNLAIHSSLAETGPLVLLEYLSAGLPFIAYKTGSAAEKISDFLPAMLMNDFDLNNWRQQVALILNDSMLPQKMRELFNQEFSPEKYIGQCLQIYKSIHS